MGLDSPDRGAAGHANNAGSRRHLQLAGDGQRPVRLAELARAGVFLAEPAITRGHGALIPADGGRLAGAHRDETSVPQGRTAWADARGKLR